MKILYYDTDNQELLISKKHADKNKQLNKILQFSINDPTIEHIYECDNLIKDNLALFNQLLNFNTKYYRITNNYLINHMSKNDIKKSFMSLSIDSQNICNKLITIIKQYDNDFNQINNLIIACLIQEKYQNLFIKFIKENKNMTKQDLMTAFYKQYPELKTQHIFIFANKIDNINLFHKSQNAANIINHTQGYTAMRPVDDTPYMLNGLLYDSTWGYHISFDNNYLKQFIYYANDSIFITQYRKNVVGCTKLDFFVAIPHPDDESKILIDDKGNCELDSNYVRNYYTQHYLE